MSDQSPHDDAIALGRFEGTYRDRERLKVDVSRGIRDRHVAGEVLDPERERSPIAVLAGDLAMVTSISRSSLASIVSRSTTLRDHVPTLSAHNAMNEEGR